MTYPYPTAQTRPDQTRPDQTRPETRPGLGFGDGFSERAGGAGADEAGLMEECKAFFRVWLKSRPRRISELAEQDEADYRDDNVMELKMIAFDTFEKRLEGQKKKKRRNSRRKKID
jgi:hypothetical protein